MTDRFEIRHYDEISRSETTYRMLCANLGDTIRAASHGKVTMSEWLHTQFDSVAQFDALTHINPLIPNAHVLQIGGVGLTALRTLAAGAAKATLVTPSSGELEVTRRAAEHFGLSNRFAGIEAYGEALPFADGSFEITLSEASLHHTNFRMALGEIHRVLRVDGRFACFEPWRAPLYRSGTKILGKRDPAVHCRPLDYERTMGIQDIFPGLEITWHGAFTRYPMIALNKIGIPVSRRIAHRTTRVDDAFSKRLPRLRQHLGSSVSMVGTKTVG